ncbi:hypothetical protein ACS0TY_022324 [Phlomoides rotata]
METSPIGALKLNSDAACFSDGLVGFGFIIRNERGEVQLAGTKHCSAGGNNTLIKAFALRFGMQMSMVRGFRPRILESDCHNLILALTGRLEGNPQTMMIVDDILSMRTPWTILPSPSPRGKQTAWHTTWHTSARSRISFKYGSGMCPFVVTMTWSMM